MKPITKDAWMEVTQTACDIANACLQEDDVMMNVHKSTMFDLLDQLEQEFGVHPQTVSTRADYTDDKEERRQLYHQALELARLNGDGVEETETRDSLRHLDES